MMKQKIIEVVFIAHHKNTMTLYLFARTMTLYLPIQYTLFHPDYQYQNNIYQSNSMTTNKATSS